MMLPSRCNSAEILSQKYDASGAPGGSLVINKDGDEDAENNYEGTYDLSVKGDKRHHRAKALAEQNHHLRKKRSNNRSTG